MELLSLLIYNISLWTASANNFISKNINMFKVKVSVLLFLEPFWWIENCLRRYCFIWPVYVLDLQATKFSGFNFGKTCWLWLLGLWTTFKWYFCKTFSILSAVPHTNERQTSFKIYLVSVVRQVSTFHTSITSHSSSSLSELATIEKTGAPIAV